MGVDDPAPVLGDEAVHDLAVRGEGAKRPDLVDAHEAAKPATSATKIAASLRLPVPSRPLVHPGHSDRSVGRLRVRMQVFRS